MIDRFAEYENRVAARIVKNAKARTADLRKGKAFFGHATDQTMGKAFHPFHKAIIPPGDLGKGHERFGKPTEILAYFLDGPTEDLIFPLNILGFNLRYPLLHHERLLDGPLPVIQTKKAILVP
jgi:hypothetical protein